MTLMWIALHGLVAFLCAAGLVASFVLIALACAALALRERHRLGNYPRAWRPWARRLRAALVVTFASFLFAFWLASTRGAAAERADQSAVLWGPSAFAAGVLAIYFAGRDRKPSAPKLE